MVWVVSKSLVSDRHTLQKNSRESASKEQYYIADPQVPAYVTKGH